MKNATLKGCRKTYAQPFQGWDLFVLITQGSALARATLAEGSKYFRRKPNSTGLLKSRIVRRVKYHQSLGEISRHRSDETIVIQPQHLKR